MTPKSDFLLIGARKITPKESMNTTNFGKISLFVEQDYKQQTSTCWSVFVGHIHFKKLLKFRKFIEIFHCCVTRLRGTNLGDFIQCLYTRTILRNKNMEQSLFKKHSKFQNFDEIFYCGMTRHRNSILNYCGLCRYVKAIKPKKVVRQSLFKNHLKFQNFNIQ